MKKNLKEEINRAKAIWGYNTSLTLNEQTTGGNTPICMKMTMQGCPGTSNANYTTNSSITKCATIDNVPVTASDVGRTIMQPMGGMIVVQSVTTNVNGNGSMNYYSAPGPCPRPNTSTGTTTDPFYCLGGVAGVTCVQTSTPPGGITAAGPFNTLADCQNSGCINSGATADWWCDPTGAYVNANGGNCAQSTNKPQSYFTGPYPTEFDCELACDDTTPPTTGSSCNKACQQLVPGFKNKAGNKPCNWLNNRLNAFTNKLATKTPGSCQHKRIECKIGVVQTLLQQNGC